MLHHYVKDKNRIYTLKSDSSDHNNIVSHPAHFTPVDKFSKYRLLTKIKYNIKPFDNLNKDHCF